MDFVKKIPPVWIAVAVLVVVVLVLLFQQRRSGYTPSAGAPITLMDLQEFSGFTTEQKSMYTQALSESSNDLRNAVVSGSPEDVQLIITSIMRRAMQPTPQMPTPQMPTPQMPLPSM